MTQFAAVSHAGLKRDHNEDSFEANPELGLWLVADGVGGHSFGEVASAVVSNTITAACREGTALPAAVQSAHAAVLAEISDQAVGMGMGSTVVALRLRGQHYELAWVGDSRAYLWDGDQLRQLTRDHTHVTDLLEGGVLSREEAAKHPDRHVLTQSIGVFADMELKPGSTDGDYSAGQQFLLCSDGLSDELSDEAIADLLRCNDTAQAQVDSLLDAALSAGGKDNTTIIVVGAASDRDVGDEAEIAPKMEGQKSTNAGTENLAREQARLGRMFWLSMTVLVGIAIISWFLIY